MSTWKDAARWAIVESKRRLNNPRDIRDVMVTTSPGSKPGDGNVGWSEVRAKFPELCGGNIVDDRLAFDEAFREVQNEG